MMLMRPIGFGKRLRRCLRDRARYLMTRSDRRSKLRTITVGGRHDFDRLPFVQGCFEILHLFACACASEAPPAHFIDHLHI
jgi:hypothetical protein